MSVTFLEWTPHMAHKKNYDKKKQRGGHWDCEGGGAGLGESHQGWWKCWRVEWGWEGVWGGERGGGQGGVWVGVWDGIWLII